MRRLEQSAAPFGERLTESTLRGLNVITENMVNTGTPYGSPEQIKTMIVLNGLFCIELGFPKLPTVHVRRAEFAYVQSLGYCYSLGPGLGTRFGGK